MDPNFIVSDLVFCPKVITFVYSESGEIKGELEVNNNSNDDYLFLLKCNNSASFFIEPRCGILQNKTDVSIDILFMGEKEMAAEIMGEDWTLYIAPSDLIIGSRPQDEMIERFFSVN